MNLKGILTLALLVCLISARAATPQSSTDLWDISQGTVVTATSGVGDAGTLGMFGGIGYISEPGTTLFNGGATQFVEWRTPSVVAVQTIRLFTRGDSDTIYRAFSKFVLKIKSPGSVTFDQTVFTWIPAQPFVQLDTSSWMVLNTNITMFSARDFRAEFTIINEGSRVMELDAFGPPPTDPAKITQNPASQSVFTGANAIFAINVEGSAPLSIQWQQNGAPVTLSDRVELVDGYSLSIKNVSLADAGAYKVTVTNQWGGAESPVVNLTVTADEASPVVTIRKPTPGTYRGVVDLEGTVADNQPASVRWEKNGTPMGSLTLVDGVFYAPSVAIQNGENLIRVIATDPVGNVGSAQVTVFSSLVVQSGDDLFDVSQGTVMTATSGTFSGSPTPGMLGSLDDIEFGNTIFADGHPAGFVHTMDWNTVSSVTVTNLKVFTRGDNGGVYREFAQFTLKAKSPGSAVFDLTLFSFTPASHPIAMLDADSFLVLDTNIAAVTAQEFRAEVVQLNAGPRVIELDAYGPATLGPPLVIQQPQDAAGFIGGAASFGAVVSGARPLNFQWRHAGTNLVESSSVKGVNSSILKLSNLAPADAGDYSFTLVNNAGNVMSSNAVLTVTADTVAPVVTITSPVAGTVGDQIFTLDGTLNENDRIASLRWYRNGTNMGPVAFSDSTFFTSGLRLLAGENRIRVVAIDGATNQGAAEVVVHWAPTRALILESPAPQQEGARITVPVFLVSTGGVSAATFVLGFDTNLVTDPQFEWVSEGDLGLTSVNLESNKRYRASFALAATAVPGGTRTLANVSFRARSVSTNRAVAFTVDLVGLYDPTGEQYLDGNYVQGATGSITRRKITGDNNANDRLDVGDATVILRLASRVDFPRSWDVTGNDLNKNNDVDSGDVVRVLRAVVGIDPQPLVPAGLKAQNGGTLPPDGRIALVAEKAMASVGEKFTIEARVNGKSHPVAGATFRLEYPVGALRLENASAHEAGGMVPSTGALLAWNLAPTVSDYAAQNGAITFGASSANVWATNNGTLARFTFTVQPGAVARYGWPIQIRNVETTPNGFRTEPLAGATLNFVTRPPVPAEFGEAIRFGANGSPRLSFRGDAGARYLIHASSDLNNWSLLGTFATETSDMIEIEDTGSTGELARFYRATLIQ